MYPTHQWQFILEQYYQLSIILYDHVIVFSNWLFFLNAYLEYSQEQTVVIATKSGVLLKMEFPLILVARQRTSHVLYLLSISLLQNIANTLFDTIGEIKGPLLYCFRFEMILNSLLLSQKCRQRERTSLRDALRLPSNSILKIIRHQLLYAMNFEGSFYMCIKFQW